MSSIPWVGCAWRPSPPLITATLGLTCSAMKCAAPESLWRTTNMSAAIASRLRRVSVSVSPLLVEEVDTFRLITSADSRWAARLEGGAGARGVLEEHVANGLAAQQRDLLHRAGADFQEGVSGVEDFGE